MIRVTPGAQVSTATPLPVPTFTVTAASGLFTGSRLTGQIVQIVVASVLIFAALAVGLIIGRRLAGRQGKSDGPDESGGSV